MAELPVTFCLPELDDPSTVEALSPDRDWQAFATTRNTWIAQTFLRLRDAGHPVMLARVPPERGVLVIEATSRRRLFAGGLDPRLLLVAVRADHRPQRYADVEILQNDRFADGESRFFVPHWPQPGLVPRDPSRGPRVRTVAFKGHSGNLHPDFRSARWRRFLDGLGVGWRDEGLPWRGQEADYDGCRWNDFSEVDLVVAVREHWREPYLRKPASKLANAWLAGVPAILGPEYAYGRLRRSPLDFFEVTSLDEAMEAVRRLHDDPALYAAVVARGRERAREVSVEAVTARWATLLFETLRPRAEARATRPLAALDRLYKRARHRLGRWAPQRRAALREPAPGAAAAD